MGLESLYVLMFYLTIGLQLDVWSKGQQSIKPMLHPHAPKENPTASFLRENIPFWFLTEHLPTQETETTQIKKGGQ